VRSRFRNGFKFEFRQNLDILLTKQLINPPFIYLIEYIHAHNAYIFVQKNFPEYPNFSYYFSSRCLCLILTKQPG